MSLAMQENRFELKYIIDEMKALRVRQFAQSYLVPDPYADPKTYSYAIHSLYLDSPGLDLARATMHGHKNRFKLRVRYYDDKPSHPLFFEIKRRVNNAILKRRAPLWRSSLMAILDGHWPARSDMVNPFDGRALDAASFFCDLRGRINALPQVIVSYIREAWVTPNNNAVRLTFDRQLTATAWKGELRTDVFENGIHPKVGGVVLELKYTDRFPNWMGDMARALNLDRFCMAKYVHCVLAIKSPEVLRPIGHIEAYI